MELDVLTNLELREDNFFHMREDKQKFQMFKKRISLEDVHRIEVVHRVLAFRFQPWRVREKEEK